jgi:hypothetical protein
VCTSSGGQPNDICTRAPGTMSSFQASHGSSSSSTPNLKWPRSNSPLNSAKASGLWMNLSSLPASHSLWKRRPSSLKSQACSSSKPTNIRRPGQFLVRSLRSSMANTSPASTLSMDLGSTWSQQSCSQLPSSEKSMSSSPSSRTGTSSCISAKLALRSPPQREVSPSVAKLAFLVAKLREVTRSYSEGENPSRPVRAIGGAGAGAAGRGAETAASAAGRRAGGGGGRDGGG